jgi:hypothetical protein
VIQAIGLKAVKNFMEDQLKLLRLRYLGEKISNNIKKSNFDHLKKVEVARVEA